MRLSRGSAPFDSDEFIYELKIDGFRSLAYIENGQCDLVSRKGNTCRKFKDLALWIGENLRVENAVIDDEISCSDDSGRPIFNDLLFRRRECLFFAFDLLHLNGKDLRDLPLVERKARLKRLPAPEALTDTLGRSHREARPALVPLARWVQELLQGMLGATSSRIQCPR